MAAMWRYRTVQQKIRQTYFFLIFGPWRLLPLLLRSAVFLSKWPLCEGTTKHSPKLTSSSSLDAASSFPSYLGPLSFCQHGHYQYVKVQHKNPPKLTSSSTLGPGNFSPSSSLGQLSFCQNGRCVKVVQHKNPPNLPLPLLWTLKAPSPPP
jgi:hypothetical protein